MKTTTNGLSNFILTPVEMERKTICVVALLFFVGIWPTTSAVSARSPSEQQQKHLAAPAEQNVGAGWRKAFIFGLITLIFVGYFLMGSEIDLNTVWHTCRLPIAPSLGVFAHFVVMPLSAFFLGWVLFSDEGDTSAYFRLALFITGCAPAGGASNFWTLVFGGNVSLSVTMSFISTVCSFGLMPLWLGVFGTLLFPHHIIGANDASAAVRNGTTPQQDATTVGMHIPFGRIAETLFMLVVPLLIGVAVGRYVPKAAVFFRMMLRPFALVALVFIIIMGALTHYAIFFHITARAVVACLLLPMCGYAFGLAAAWTTRRRHVDLIAIAIESGVQNTGVAIAVFQTSFPADVGALCTLVPVLVACGTPLPLLITYLTLWAVGKRPQRYVPSEADDDDGAMKGVKKMNQPKRLSKLNAVQPATIDKQQMNAIAIVVEGKEVAGKMTAEPVGKRQREA